MLSLVVPVVSAQSEPAPEAEPARQQARSSSVIGLSGGAAQNGPALRLIVGSERRLSDHVSLGLVSRVMGARGPYAVFGDTSASDDLYAELGLSLRPVWRPSDQLQLAASVGYGVAALKVSDRLYAPVDDIGFTIPVEVEGSVRVWRNVGLTASASRSFALSSLRTESEVAPGPDGYALTNQTATVGLRVGGW